MRRLVAVTGPDGAGKSTVCTRLALQLGAHEVSVWDTLGRGGPFATKAEVLAHVGALDGVERMLTIMDLLRRAMALPEARAAHTLVLNGYWFKYAASELAYGVARTAVAEAVADFPAPDCTFFLDLAPAEAWRRKGAGSVYERGLMGGGWPGAAFAGATPGEEFVAFQQAIRRHWEELERQHGPWIHVSTVSPVEQVVERVAGTLAPVRLRAAGGR